MDAQALFAKSYLQSRERFRASLDKIRLRWPSARLVTVPLPGEEDLTIDWIEAEPLEKKEKLLFFTSGEHGIEAYAGTAMLQLCIEEFLPQLDPRTTGLALLHVINPWGMSHLRRGNRSNVDLNRSFVWEDKDLDPAFNPEYTRLESFLAPKKKVGSVFQCKAWFIWNVLRTILTAGQKTLSSSMLLGQYRYEQAVYFGGKERQPETRVIMDLMRRIFADYERFVHLDMHTGFGPRYQMSVVNSYLDARNSTDLAKTYNYPLIVKANPQEFYAIRGDMIDFVYTLCEREFPGKPFYATCFEFGAYGDSLTANLRALRSTILENRAWWNGGDPEAVRWIAGEWREGFIPSEPAWREKAVQDARQAMQGILKAEGYISS